MGGDEERIRIDSKPISQEMFANNVIEVWERLSSDTSDVEHMPRYLQLLALVSVHTFVKEKVNVAIYETHNGGEFDATNVFNKPAVTGITTLDMDHVRQLGPDISNIAWHKSGIFQAGCPAFSTVQASASATSVLKRRAEEKGVPLKFVDIDPDLPADVPQPMVQRYNSSLALALTRSFIQQKAPPGSSSLQLQDIHHGIRSFNLIGRFEEIRDGRYRWFLDGAHNEVSLPIAAEWFNSMINSNSKSVHPPLPKPCSLTLTSSKATPPPATEASASSYSAKSHNHAASSQF